MVAVFVLVIVLVACVCVIDCTICSAVCGCVLLGDGWCDGVVCVCVMCLFGDVSVVVGG